MTATKRFCKYLALRHMDMQSLLDLTRDIIEKYLIYLQTEAKDRKNYRTDLYSLRRVIEDVGNHYDRQDIKCLFISNDFPSTPRYLFRFYSDETIKRLNEYIFQMDEQIARALILHQLLGTRISDTLTLKTDCLSIRENRYFIRIEQVKSITYEKAISDEVARLIIKAIDYTEQQYGKTEYIFVKKDDPSKPFQYSMLQNQVMKLIRRNDIRAENGELLNFGTHMFRHCYGKKLTEMHIDDWMIARLLGHKTLQSVSYYRKIGNKMMADETRAARERIDMILLDIVKEWDGYEYDKMIAVNKAESEKKVEKAIQAIEDMRSRGVQVSVTELTRCTGLSRGFFYKNMLVRQKLDEVTKQFSPIREGQTVRDQFVRDNKLQAIREDFGKSEAENQRLKLENAKLAQRCTDLQKEVDALKKTVGSKRNCFTEKNIEELKLKYDKIVRMKKQEAKQNLEIARIEIENMLKSGESINVTALAKRVGVSRSYFYRNKEATRLVNQALEKEEHILKEHAGVVHIPEDIEEKIIDLRIEIMRLESENAKLREILRDNGYEI